MNTNDALDTAFAFPKSTVIPLHFEGWSHYTEDGQVLEAAFAAAGIEKRLLFPPAGETVAL